MNKGADNPELERRKGLTFMQAEGLAPLPRQLKRKELSSELRRDLSDFCYEWLGMEEPGRELSNQASALFLPVWKSSIFTGKKSDFPVYNKFTLWKKIEPVFTSRWAHIYEILTCILRVPSCPTFLKKEMGEILTRHRAAYRVIEDTLMPVTSEADADAVKKNLSITSEAGEKSAMQYFKESAEELEQGKYANSVRSSISAVESVVRRRLGTGDLKSGLMKLKKSKHMHDVFEAALNKLYAYTNSEGGIRHAIIAGPKAKVDEATALFMFSACAAFVGYIINQTRSRPLDG